MKYIFLTVFLISFAPSEANATVQSMQLTITLNRNNRLQVWQNFITKNLNTLETILSNQKKTERFDAIYNLLEQAVQNNVNGFVSLKLYEIKIPHLSLKNGSSLYSQDPLLYARTIDSIKIILTFYPNTIQDWNTFINQNRNILKTTKTPYLKNNLLDTIKTILSSAVQDGIVTYSSVEQLCTLNSYHINILALEKLALGT